jgi:hypothetical protein
MSSLLSACGFVFCFIEEAESIVFWDRLTIIRLEKAYENFGSVAP